MAYLCYLALILTSFLDSLLNLTSIDFICQSHINPSVYLVVSSAVHHVVLVLSLWGHMRSLPPEVRCSCVTCFGPWNVSQPCVTPGQKLLTASALICHLSFPLCNGLGRIKMNSYQPGWLLSGCGEHSPFPSNPVPHWSNSIREKQTFVVTNHWNFRILLVQYNLTLTSLKSVN